MKLTKENAEEIKSRILDVYEMHAALCSETKLYIYRDKFGFVVTTRQEGRLIVDIAAPYFDPDIWEVKEDGLPTRESLEEYLDGTTVEISVDNEENCDIVKIVVSDFDCTLSAIEEEIYY